MTEVDELDAEQSYFDRAQEAREQRRHAVGDVAAGMAHPRQGVAGRRHADKVREMLGEPDDAVALGRLDLVDDEEPIYIGKHLIRDEAGDVLVVNWQAPVAKAFHKATVRDDLGARRKRVFECKKNKIIDFQDLVFRELRSQIDQLGIDTPQPFDDALLKDLDRSRSGEMQDIVKTIQAAQYDLMEADLDQILVVQGGPGTGKTVVALHRVSWLLFNHQDVLGPEDVLVVGPSKTFVRYIKQVLPSLGDEQVDQRDLTELGPRVSLRREEPSAVLRVKGDLKMRTVLDRALSDRVLTPSDDLEVRTPNRVMVLSKGGVAQRIEELRGQPYSTGRTQLREWAKRNLETKYGETPPAEALNQAIDRVWPQLSPPALLQDLLGSQDRLLRAAGEELTAREVNLLYRQSSSRLGDEAWSVGDVPLLDHLEAAMGGGEQRRYRHVVVDEAQDLTPMQLASLARRLTHPSMTLLGDIAQSTGAWTRDSWHELLIQLTALAPGEATSVVRELEFGYRVPKQVYELAARLLEVIAPEVAAPTVVRTGPADPVLLLEDIEDVAVRAVEQAQSFASRGYLVGIICPDSRRSELEQVMRSREVLWHDTAESGLTAGINLLSPETAKGLEFDACIVTFPEEIVDGDARVGGRLLYIALTRCTQQLAVVHTSTFDGGVLTTSSPVEPSEEGLWPADHVQDALPIQTATAPAPRATTPVEKPEPAVARPPRLVRNMAQELAEEVRGTLRPEHFSFLVAELQRLLQDAPPAEESAEEAAPE